MKNFKSYYTFALTFILSLFLISCNGDKPGNEIPIVPTKPIKETATFPYGAAINIRNLRNNPSYDSIIKAEFNSITAENVMKMAAVSTGKDKFNWTDVDFLVDYTQSNNIRLHGHCLIWHKSVPSWVSNFNGTKDDWKILLKNYITDYVTRYKGKVASWDVVNEALLDDGKPRTESIWYQKIGWEYVELSFIYAHAADPQVVLFYNDYGQEYSATKLKAINDTVQNMINRGVPIHGVGLQLHTHINHPANLMSNAINQTALISTNNGQKLKVHVSELDVALNPSKNINYTISDADLEAQKTRYRIITSTMRALPKEQCWGISTWGVVDSDSWLSGSPDFPLIFTSNFKQKPCYKGILEAFAIK